MSVIARDALMEPFLEGKRSFTHGVTFGGHPLQALDVVGALRPSLGRPGR